MSGLRFSKTIVAINGGVPLVILGWDAWHHRLGADPVNYLTRTTGMLALIFLLLSLTVTPVRRITGWNMLVSYRRSLGLYGFAYACVHLGIYVGLDRALNLRSAVHEILNRRYLQIGFAGVVVMVPLAVTSTDGMIRRLGPRRWKALHRLAYVAAVAGAVHYYLLVKSDVRQPLAFAGVLAVLLLCRAVWHYLDLRRAAARGARAPAGATGVAGFNPVMATTSSAPGASGKFWSGELQVVRTFDETPEIRTFRLAPTAGDDLPFDYRPGQYLTLRLTVDGRPVNRSYTIASSPTRRGYCEVTVKREEMGVSSGHLHRQVRQGDRLMVAAPAGRFVFTGEQADSVVLIAGGVGVTPLMSMLRYLTDHSWTGEIFLLMAARTERDILFRDEIEQLRRRFTNLHVCVTLSRPAADAGWSGDRGRITAELLTRFIPELKRRLVYLCGPAEMMAATTAMLGALGLPEANLKTEAFAAGVSQVAEPDAVASEPDAVASEPDAVASEPDAVASEPGAAGEASIETSEAPRGNMASAASGSARNVSFVKSDRVSPLLDGTTVLEAAEGVGVDIPFECRAGVCGQCKTKLIAGSVVMATEEALSRAEKAAGWILACQARGSDGNIAVQA